jgi:ribosomal protein S2
MNMLVRTSTYFQLCFRICHCLEVNAEKTKYISVSHHHNAGQNHDIKLANRCFENVVQFRYLGMTVTNQNLIQEEIKEIEFR